MLLLPLRSLTIPTLTDFPSLTVHLVSIYGRTLLVTMVAVSAIHQPLPHPHHPLLASTSTVMGGQKDLTLIHGTLSTPFGTVKVVLPATPAATHQTCCGSTGHSTQPALMTLKYVSAVMKIMKTLEWICLNCMCTERSKLFNYCQC